MIHAVVLAAGESRRMGEPKMLLPWGDRTVLGAVVATLLASPVDSVVVVLGHRAAEVSAALHPFAGEGRLRTVTNPDYKAGMLTSIQCGARAAGSGSLLVALGDQPLITPEAVTTLIGAHQGGLTVPLYEGRRGHPVCIDQSLVEPLLALPPDLGLRGLFHQVPDRVITVPVSAPGILIDLDTPADYQRHRAAMRGREALP